MKINVTILGKVYELDKGLTLKQIAKLVQDSYKYEIILAKIDNEIKELNTKVEEDCEIEFFDLTSSVANKVYLNGLIFLMSHAYKRIAHGNIKVNHSLDKGLYISTDKKIDEELLKKLDEEMRSIVKQDILIEKINVERMNVIEYYKNTKDYEKLNNMIYNTNTIITLYKMESSYIYLYSKMPPSTGVLSHFELTYIDEGGFVLRFPTIYINDQIKPYEHRKNIFHLFKTTRAWAKTIGIEYVCDLNEKVSNSNINEIIRMDEIKKNAELLEVAEQIASQKEKRIILIAGPSSSGKTTTTNKLCLCLKSCGLVPTMISMDDYFVERDQTPLDKNGEPDFEKLETVDLELFNKTINSLINGEEVVVPTYNFLTGKKEFKSKMKLEENQVLLIEGIHALNTEILENIPSSKKCRIYLSALTELNVDKHTRISTTDNRLLRRIVRDNRTRGYKVEQTLKAWEKVREGEEENIFPFQDTADFTLNTAMIYEIGILKIYVEPLLYSVPVTSEYYNDAKRLINFLRVFLPISPEEVPIDSIIREFIGGGCFKI